MTGLAARIRSAATAGGCAALVLLLCAAPARSQEPAPTDDEILKAKCTLCHSGHRIYQIDPAQIAPILERMRKLNPDWITAADSDHIADVIARVLKDPSAVQSRDAWKAAVERGKELYTSAALGTTGKSCSSCHAAGSLKNVEDAYPKFDPVLKRFVDLNEAINRMIQEKMKGTPLPPNDQKYFDLIAYIKTL